MVTTYDWVGVRFQADNKPDKLMVDIYTQSRWHVPTLYQCTCNSHCCCWFFSEVVLKYEILSVYPVVMRLYEQLWELQQIKPYIQQFYHAYLSTCSPSHFLPSAHTPLARSPAGFPLLSCCTTSTCILSSLSYAVPLHPILPHHSRSPTPIVSLSSFCPPSLFCLMKTLLVFIPIIGTFFNAYFTCKLRKKLQY